ncbi:hypothetical protein C266_13884 [Pandoraea sp. SD6-2]|nr:hypothetical protein C266_13884 [Pandoraea sp. SD6-2]
MWRYAASLIGGMVGGYFVAKFWQYPPSSSQDAAAWVQAVGSIMAIAGAVWIFRAQRRGDRRDKWDGMLAIVTVVKADIQSIYAFCDTTNASRFDPDLYFDEIYRPENFAHVDDLLSAIPVHEIPYAWAAWNLIALRRELRRLADLLAGMNQSHLRLGKEGVIDECVIAMEHARAIKNLADGVRDRQSVHHM